ncbi:hypothetical protein RHMOL_Rhmol01G0177700 [Rhododendron molle]|uniref:Uncharacterized protein n=1 Tax=Rhododendron molle TaxID=49168 RepID=A0ACC0Q471_RHOML|nr:hypothetical protein RHMOL_Rhmol01G0177700 [Rhododendron molle]
MEKLRPPPPPSPFDNVAIAPPHLVFLCHITGRGGRDHDRLIETAYEKNTQFSICILVSDFISAPGAGAERRLKEANRNGGGFPLVESSRQAMFSPMSTLDRFARGSPWTPRSSVDKEERAIAEKWSFLHPSPLSTPRGGLEPEQLPLFILLIFQLFF